MMETGTQYPSTRYSIRRPRFRGPNKKTPAQRQRFKNDSYHALTKRGVNNQLVDWASTTASLWCREFEGVAFHFFPLLLLFVGQDFHG